MFCLYSSFQPLLLFVFSPLFKLSSAQLSSGLSSWSATTAQSLGSQGRCFASEVPGSAWQPRCRPRSWDVFCIFSLFADVCYLKTPWRATEDVPVGPFGGDYVPSPHFTRFPILQCFLGLQVWGLTHSRFFFLVGYCDDLVVSLVGFQWILQGCV